MDPELAAVFKRRRNQENQANNERSVPVRKCTPKTEARPEPLKKLIKDDPSGEKEKKENKRHTRVDSASLKTREQNDEEEGCSSLPVRVYNDGPPVQEGKNRQSLPAVRIQNDHPPVQEKTNSQGLPAAVRIKTDRPSVQERKDCRIQTDRPSVQEKKDYQNKPRQNQTDRPSVQAEKDCRHQQRRIQTDRPSVQEKKNRRSLPPRIQNDCSPAQEKKKENDHDSQDEATSMRTSDHTDEEEGSRSLPVRKIDADKGYNKVEEQEFSPWETKKRKFCILVLFVLMATLIALVVSLIQFQAKDSNVDANGGGRVPRNPYPNYPGAPSPSVGNYPGPSTHQPTAVPPLKLYLEDELGIAIKSNDANLAIAQLLEEAKANGGNREVPLTPKTVQRYALINMDLALVRNSNAIARQTELIWGKFNQDECQWTGVTCNGNQQVTNITLGSQGLTGTIPTEVGLLESLTYLDISKNDLQGSLPEELYDVVSLQKIFLYKNQLSGTISTKLGNMWNLTDLVLHSNQISGPIPPTMKSGSRGIFPIKYFNVFNNQMTGTLPANMKLRILYYMDLGRNQFSGTLPEEFGVDAVRLRHLFLDHNQFSGTVPSSIVNTGNGRLHSLTLNDNRLTGPLPGNDESTEMNQMEVQNNLFTSMDSDTCKLWVFTGGELVEFKSDCDICDCGDNRGRYGARELVVIQEQVS